jgi:hypothetical protein
MLAAGPRRSYGLGASSLRFPPQPAHGCGATGA